MNKRHSSAGFTLIEVMLVVFILALTAMAFAATFPAGQISRIKAAHMSYAVNLARQTMEDKRSAGYINLLPGETEISIPADLPGSELRTTITQYSASVKKVEVQITWTGYRKVGGSTTLVTLISDHS